MVPATVYGKTTDPASIEVNAHEFRNVYRQTGETGLINLSVENDIRPVLVKNVQLDPVSMKTIHVEFHQVNLKEKIRAHVPVVVTGESLAIKEKTGTLLQLLDEVEVEALPADLPERIEVDISGLANVNDHVVAKELPVKKEVTLLTDPDIMVVKIGELLAPEPEPEPTPAPVEEEGAPDQEVSSEKIKEEQGIEEKQEPPVKPEESQKK